MTERELYERRREEREAEELERDAGSDRRRRLCWRVVAILIPIVLCFMLSFVFVPFYLIRAIMGKDPWEVVLPGIVLGSFILARLLVLYALWFMAL